jgi:hypothetical protein
MAVLDGNFALGCGPVMDCPYIHIFQCMLKQSDDTTNEVLEPITLILIYSTVLQWTRTKLHPGSLWKHLSAVTSLKLIINSCVSNSEFIHLCKDLLNVKQAHRFLLARE